MTRPARRAEIRAEREAREREEQEEAYRKSRLCLEFAIDELPLDDDTKEVLRRIARAAGVDLFENGAGE